MAERERTMRKHTKAEGGSNLRRSSAKRPDDVQKKPSGKSPRFAHQSQDLHSHYGNVPNRSTGSRGKATDQTSQTQKVQVPRRGFSEFQLRLVLAILNSVMVERKSLDKAYALWFAKVKLDSVEQGFIIHSINAMFARLSYYAYAAGLKRPGDFAGHLARLPFVYSREHSWDLPQLPPDENIDRRGLDTRLNQGREDVLLQEGCPQWLEDLGSRALKERWPQERKALGAAALRFIRCNTLKITRDELASRLAEEGVVTRPVKGSSEALEVTSNAALFRTQCFRSGFFEQQDPGSQQIAHFCQVEGVRKVIDACAGSGGKTLHLAALLHGKGTIIALDTEQWKLNELKKRARRAGAFNIETRLIDSTKVVKRLHDQADVVLIDAPCSGIGVLRRTPDSKWRDGREHLKEIKSTQCEILQRYAKMVKAGGAVIYSTCSILPEENEEQVKAFLDSHQDQFVLEEQRQLWPSEGTDGFYMARLRNIARPDSKEEPEPPSDDETPQPSNTAESTASLDEPTDHVTDTAPISAEADTERT